MEFIGDIQLSSNLVIHDVLVIPNFCFNLLFIGSLTKESLLMVNFVVDSCLILDKSASKTIGNGGL